MSIDARRGAIRQDIKNVTQEISKLKDGFYGNESANDVSDLIDRIRDKKLYREQRRRELRRLL